MIRTYPHALRVRGRSVAPTPVPRGTPSPPRRLAFIDTTDTSHRHVHASNTSQVGAALETSRDVGTRCLQAGSPGDSTHAGSTS